jgi:thioredoxin 1
MVAWSALAPALRPENHRQASHLRKKRIHLHFVLQQHDKRLALTTRKSGPYYQLVSIINTGTHGWCKLGAVMASENVKEFTDSNFETEVLKSAQPVLVDFWAEWCMPCKMLTPTIEKLAKDYVGKVKVGKVDTDSNRDISVKYGISAIPTVILFKNGQVAHKFVGLRKENEFKEALDANA